MHKDLLVLLFKNPNEWEQWLAKNHDKLSAVWIKFAKKNTGAHSISYDEQILQGYPG